MCLTSDRFLDEFAYVGSVGAGVKSDDDNFNEARDKKGLVGADLRRTGLVGSAVISNRVILCDDFDRFRRAASLPADVGLLRSQAAIDLSALIARPSSSCTARSKASSSERWFRIRDNFGHVAR